MRNFPVMVVVMAILLLPPFLHAEDAASRSFLFTYSGVVTGPAPEKTARIWLPVPSSDQDQSVDLIQKQLPAAPRLNSSPKGDNHFLYMEARAGKDGTIAFSLTYRVTRREVAEETPAKNQVVSDYLRPDSLVPASGEPAITMLAGKQLPKDPFMAGRMLYDLVDDHMQYRKDKPGWGRGDAIWACQSGFGNCTDFHSLFISLARSEEIPAKFEMGFLLPTKHGSGEVAGYHCWAKFFASGHGWVPVDISEANKDPAKRGYFFGHLCENRVMFSTGRDIELLPRQSGPPVNFFIYPYVEVAGQPWPQNKIEHHFSYSDAAAQPQVQLSVQVNRDQH